MSGMRIWGRRGRGGTRLPGWQIDGGRWCNRMRSLVPLVGVVAGGADDGRHDSAKQEAGGKDNEVAGHGVVAGGWW